MINGTNLLGKDKPRPPSGNTTETIKLLTATRLAAPPGEPRRRFSAFPAWLNGLPRRIGTRLYARTDIEAGWWHWQITELRGGLARSYRDIRFDVLHQLHELTSRHDLARTGSPDEPSEPEALGSLGPVLSRGPGWRRALSAASPQAITLRFSSRDPFAGTLPESER